MTNPTRRPGIDPELDGVDGLTDQEEPATALLDPAIAANRDLALRIADVIADTPAANTLVLDIHQLSPVADFFVICSGDNERQVRAIGREVLERLAEDGVRPERSEGNAPSGWILLDFGDVIVHVFDAEQRAFYRLEDLWAEAPTLLAIQ